MTHRELAEPVRYLVPTAIPGLELMQARFVRQHFARHFHETYALGCIEDGAMAFRYRGEGVVAAAGEINLVVPGEAHDGHGATPDGWAYRMFYVSPALARAAAQAFRPDAAEAAPPHFRPGVIRDPELAACVRTVHARLFDPAVPWLEKETRLFWLLAQWIGRHAEERPPTEAGRVRFSPAARSLPVRRVHELVTERCADDLRLAELSAEAGLSPFHLLRVFTRETGLSPHDYQMQARLERAREALLASGPVRLADLAAALGFADQSHFTRAFKRRYGITPGEYRRQVRGEREFAADERG